MYSPLFQLLRNGFVSLLVLFVSLALSPTARAVTPPPDGGYPGGNTAEGDNALLDLTSGRANTAIGAGALRDNGSGNDNTAIGSAALVANAGSDNTASGSEALASNFTGSFNTANGSAALSFCTTGDSNTGVGYQALSSNSTGNFNTAVGANALSILNSNGDNNTGDNNTGIGYQALSSNTIGSSNTADGVNALFSNTSGGDNTATGFQALLKNTTGINNTANGVNALANNTTGDDNVAGGLFALDSNTTGKHNTANGSEALAANTSGSGNTAEGFQALANNKAGSNNIALGVTAGLNLTTGSNNIEIGAPGVAAEANTIRIGKSGTQKKTFVAGIRGVTVASGVGVIVGTSGQLGTVVSSAQFKEAIKPMDKASETILGLKPVTFRYKEELDPDKIPQFGLVAEEVEKVNPDLVARDEEGKPYTVRYEAVNAMLLNEFLKAYRQLQGQQTTIERQQKQIEALTTGLQKVTARVEAANSLPRVVSDN